MLNICCFATNYSLLIYLILTNSELRKRSIFILENNVNDIPYKSIKIKVKKGRNYFKEILVNILVKLLIIIFKKKISVFGQDHTLVGNKLLATDNFYLIEDGLMNYTITISEEKISRKIFNYLMGRRKINGLDKGVKKIYLTGIAPIPKEIETKVKIINLKKLWNKKTKEEKNEILSIFKFNKNIIRKINDKKYILFTQPLYEDGAISEEEKIELYKKIIFNYSKKDLIIKTHPRERTDYKKYFPEIDILNNNFPSEIFDLLNIKFEKVITIFSTAALNFSKEIKIDFYGTKVHPNLLKKWGDSEKIMKANKFFDREN